MLQASKFPFPSQYRLQANISRDIVLPQGKQALVQTARAGRASANEPGPHYSLHYFRLRAWQFDLIFILNSISINQYSLVYNCRHQGQIRVRKDPLSSGTFTWEKRNLYFCIGKMVKFRSQCWCPTAAPQKQLKNRPQNGRISNFCHFRQIRTFELTMRTKEKLPSTFRCIEK